MDGAELVGGIVDIVGFADVLEAELKVGLLEAEGAPVMVGSAEILGAELKLGFKILLSTSRQ